MKCRPCGTVRHQVLTKEMPPLARLGAALTDGAVPV